jgi:hypothetical protein
MTLIGKKSLSWYAPNIRVSILVFLDDAHRPHSCPMSNVSLANRCDLMGL